MLGGAGDDSIRNSGNNVLYQYTAGDGTYSTVINNSDVVVFVDNNWITLKDAAKLSSPQIQGTKIDGTPTLNGTDGPDKIYNEISNVIIDTGDSNDTIENYGANVTILSGDGNDSINNSGANVTINSGADNDFIFNKGNYTTINSGKDGGTIALRSGAEDNLIQYSSGNGNDTIYGFNDDSTSRLRAVPIPQK